MTLMYKQQLNDEKESKYNLQNRITDLTCINSSLKDELEDNKNM